jgi:hypothetical protein
MFCMYGKRTAPNPFLLCFPRCLVEVTASALLTFYIPPTVQHYCNCNSYSSCFLISPRERHKAQSNAIVNAMNWNETSVLSVDWEVDCDDLIPRPTINKPFSAIFAEKWTPDNCHSVQQMKFPTEEQIPISNRGDLLLYTIRTSRKPFRKS